MTMNARLGWRRRHGDPQSEDRSRTLDLASLNVPARPDSEHAARQRELTVRLIALVAGIFGAPALTLAGLATGHPIVAIGSLASAAPLTVAKLIRPPKS
jgi:hypothetical protein